MRSGLGTWYGTAALAVVLFFGQVAGVWADGSWGGSGGSRGGGSWGARSYASSGGSSGGRVGPIRRLIAHIHSHHHRGGSSGGSSGGRWGSSGGSSGGSVAYWGSSGGSSGGSRGGSSGGYASSGGSSGGYVSTYVQPGAMQSAPIVEGGAYYVDPNAPVNQPAAGQPNPVDANKPPVPEAPADGQPGDSGTTTGATDDAVLLLQVPEDCVVTINGKATKTPGTSRKFVSRNLRQDRAYSYEVQATVVRGGQTLTQTKVVDLSGGVQRDLNFEFDRAEQVLTSLSITVPADARVSLGGNETRAGGSFRYFSTKALKAGQTWNDYEIEVTWERNGETTTQTKTIDLVAGASLELNFEFDSTAVAAK